MAWIYVDDIESEILGNPDSTLAEKLVDSETLESGEFKHTEPKHEPHNHAESPCECGARVQGLKQELAETQSTLLRIIETVMRTEEQSVRLLQVVEHVAVQVDDINAHLNVHNRQSTRTDQTRQGESTLRHLADKRGDKDNATALAGEFHAEISRSSPVLERPLKQDLYTDVDFEGHQAMVKDPFQEIDVAIMRNYGRVKQRSTGTKYFDDLLTKLRTKNHMQTQAITACGKNNYEGCSKLACQHWANTSHSLAAAHEQPRGKLYHPACGSHGVEAFGSTHEPKHHDSIAEKQWPMWFGCANPCGNPPIHIPVCLSPPQISGVGLGTRRNGGLEGGHGESHRQISHGGLDRSPAYVLPPTPKDGLSHGDVEGGPRIPRKAAPHQTQGDEVYDSCIISRGNVVEQPAHRRFGANDFAGLTKKHGL